MKNFTNNFKQFTSRLSARWLIMALMLLVGTSSAWAWDINSGTTIYFDAGSWNVNKTLQIMYGHETYSECKPMTHVQGTIYSYKFSSTWGNVKQIAFFVYDQWGSEGSSVAHRINYAGDTKTDVYYLSNDSGHGTLSGNVGFNTSLNRTNNYTLPAITYTISYDANGGSGAPDAQTKTHGVTLTLSSTVPTRTGYTFTSWNTAANGIGTEYESGDSYTANADATLYAQWEACPTIAAPDITASATVCAGTQVTLSNYNGDNTNTVKWYSDAACDEVVTGQVTPTDGTKYYAKAYDEASGCYSSEYSTLTFAVNPLPNITISGNNSPVLYEDVELTAATNGTSISWEITEGDGSLSSTTGNSVTLTSSSADNVTVTATATLGSCTATDTHEVEFSEEDCTPVVSNDIQIKFYHPSAKSTDDAKKGQWWGMGTLYYSTNNSTWSTIDMGNATSGTHTETISNISKSTLYVYFQSYWTYSHDSKAKSNTLTLERGKKYDIKITRHGDNNINATATATETGSLTHDPEIIAPAVKMISAEYDEENDVIVAKGAVYKTGCGVTFWGFQYSEDGQTWGTTNEYFIRPNTGNSLSVPGEFDYSFPIPEANGGETYYIRAYALNNYNNDDYNLSSAVYSTTSLPVVIPSKTINSATISLVDSEGNSSDETVVCPQSIVYLKVSYDGGDFTDYEAADNFPGTNLELVNHDKANNNAIFSYTATATGVPNITISNDNTSITTTNDVIITLKNVAPVNAPMISISQGTICEDGSATITVNNPIANLTYTLYKETEPIGNLVNYQTGDLTEAGSYTVRAEEGVCHNYANSMPVELKVVTSDVKIGLAVDKTTVNPWQPLKLTVTAPEGYAYTIDALNDVVYTQAGNVYTVKIPRPTDQGWPIKGNSGEPAEKDITFEAKIQVTDDLTCGSSSITVKLVDTEENCKIN